MIAELKRINYPMAMKILDYFYSIHPKSSYGCMITRKLNTSWSQTYKVIEYLENNQMIKRVSSDRQINYILTEKGFMVAEQSSFIMRNLK